MKIYNRSAFAFGVVCAGGLLLFALDIVSAAWWQWVLTVVISCRYLYLGLSQTANHLADAIHQHYHGTAVRLYGKCALIKTNLPLILLAAFFSAALLIRFAFDIVIPVSAAAVFCILLTISVAYSIGLDRNIRNTIKNEMDGVQ